MRKSARVMLSVVAMGCLSGAAMANTMLYDGFNYTPNTNLSTKVAPNGQAWSETGATANIDVVTKSGNLSVAGLVPSTGGMVQFGGPGSNFKSERVAFDADPNTAGVQPAISGDVYYSLALKVTALNSLSTSGIFVAGFNNLTGAQPTQISTAGTRIYLRKVDTTHYQVGTTKNSSTAADISWDSTNRLLGANGDTLFIVGEYSIIGSVASDDVSRLWINPSASTFGNNALKPTATLTNSLGTDLLNGGSPSVASFAFRNTTTEPTILADELRIGTTWKDVTPTPVPLPAAAWGGMALLGGLGAARARKRHNA